jgi:hypothetical protein
MSALHASTSARNAAPADASSDAATEIVDLARYPILDAASPAGRALVEDCRRQLKATGSCLLHGFVRADRIEQMAREGAEVAPQAFRAPGIRKGTAYLEAPNEDFPPEHPRRRLQTSSVGAVAYDLIPPAHLLRRLYESQGMLEFLARTLGVDRLFRYADPLGALNVAVMGEGEHLFWHFDQTDFVVSVLLRDCEKGGEFEYVPNIRTPDQENYDRVGRLLDGDRSEVVTLEHRPGTLALFQGRYSIHRVAPVEGRTDRLIGLLGYDTKPDTFSSERLKLRRYGRLN